jgi:hypothetical protein
MIKKYYLLYFFLGILFLLIRPLIPPRHQLLSSLQDFLLIAGICSLIWGIVAFRLRKRPDRLVIFFQRWFLVTTVAGLIVLIFLLGLLGWLNFRSPFFVIDHVEKTLYLQALDIHETGTLPYPSPDRSPFIFDAYNPLYQMLIAGLMVVFSPGAILAKILSGTCSGLLFTLLIVLARKIKLDRFGLVLAVFIFLCASPISLLVWARNDSMLALLIAGFLFSLYRARNLPQYLLSLFFLYLAFFTKQTGLIWVGFAVLVLISRQCGWRNFLIFCLAGLALFSVTGIILDWATSGYYHFWTLTLPAQHPLKPFSSVLTAIAAILPFRLLLLPLTLLFLIFLKRPGSPLHFFSAVLARGGRSLRFFGGAALYGVILGVIPLSKTGGGYNSFLPVMVPLALSTGLLVMILIKREGTEPSAGFSGMTFASLSLVVILATLNSSGRVLATARQISKKDAAYDRTELAAVADYLVANGPKRAYFPYSMGPKTTGLSAPGIQEYFAPQFGYYLDEAALMDYLAAGFPFPEEFHRSLTEGDMEVIIVKAGYLPFSMPNTYGRWKTARCSPDLFPPLTREIFHRYFNLNKDRLPGFDLYEYQPPLKETD